MAPIVALVFTGIGAMLLALVFANLGRAYPRTGGPYHYARRAFGDFVGFQTAWAYWIAAWVGGIIGAIAVIVVALATGIAAEYRRELTLGELPSIV